MTPDRPNPPPHSPVGRGHRSLAGARARARRGAGRPGLGARDRRPPGRPARRRGRPPRAAHRRSSASPATSPTPRTAQSCSPTPRARSARSAGREQREHARREPAAGARPRSTPSVLRDVFDVERGRAARAAAGARRRCSPTTRHGREHHVRRRGRGLRGVGRLRRVEGRARARQPGPRGRAARRCGCSSSIPATCAPRCTRTRSPARTSPIDPSPDASVPGLVALIEGDAPERALRGACLRARGIEAAMIDDHARPPRRLDFVLDPAHEAHEPPEAARRPARRRAAARERRRRRAGARALRRPRRRSSRRATCVVVNTSATVPAAVDGRLPDGDPDRRALLERAARRGAAGRGAPARRAARPRRGSSTRRSTSTSSARAGCSCTRASPARSGSGSRPPTLGDDATLADFLAAHGRPDPLPARARASGRSRRTRPSSPASRAASRCRARRGRSPPSWSPTSCGGASRSCRSLLHTGVSSLEGDERPYPERYRVPAGDRRPRSTRRAQNGGRVIAIGTTVVRALATVTDDRGVVHPGRGWTDVVVTPDTPVPSVDGLVTGWHEPEATHLLMLEAIAGPARARAGLRAPRSTAGTCGTSSATATSSCARTRRDDRTDRRRARSRGCPRAGARCSTRCGGAARRPPSRSPSSSTSP